MPYLVPQPQKDQWSTGCFYENAFTKEECEKIIEFGKGIPGDEGKLFGGESDATIRQCSTSWFDWSPESDWIYERLTHFATQANSVRFGLHLTGFSEKLQFTHYRGAGDHYRWHQDFGAGKVSIRKLSLVLQLSDETGYAGGDLEFFGDEALRCRKQGTLFFFPSFEQHRVTPLVSGERFTLVAWISGPPFV